MRKPGFILLIFLIIGHLNAQDDCDQMFKQFSAEYKATIKKLHQDNPRKADSIYQIYKSKIHHLNCNNYGFIRIFSNAYSSLLFTGLNSPSRTFTYLSELKSTIKNDSVVLFVYNRLGVFKLRSNDYAGMLANLTEGYKFGATRFDSTFAERTVLVSNLALYYDWMNLEERSIEVLKHNENLIASNKIKKFDFIFDTYSSMLGYHMELANKDESKRYLNLIRNNYNNQAEDVKKSYKDALNEMLLEYHLKFGEKDLALQLYRNELNHKPNSIDYDEIMLYMEVQLMTGELDKYKAGLDTLSKYFALRNMPAKHFYNIKKNRCEILYYRAIGDDEKVTELLKEQVVMFNGNLEHILYQNEVDQIRTTSLLNRISSRAINSTFAEANATRAMLNYNLQCNLKYITNNYLKNKLHFINSSPALEVKNLFENQKSLLAKLSAEKSKILKDSFDNIQLQIHEKYLETEFFVDIINHNDILTALPKDVVYIEFNETRHSDSLNMYAYIFKENEMKMIQIPSYFTARDLLKNSNSVSYINNREINQKIYKLLLSDLSIYLKSGSRIIITPDGLYNNLAIEILSPTGKLNDAPLLNADITYTSSGSELLKMIKKNTTTSVANTNLLAVADINYQCPESAFSGSSGMDNVLRNEGRKPLLGSKIELAKLIELSKAYNSPITTLSSCKATRNLLIDKLVDKNINHFHLATHGYYLEVENNKIQYSDKMRSKVLLAKNSDNQEYLSAYEITNLNLSHIDHCFLSACNTSLGPYQEGQGNFSMAQAFKIAGVKKVISTLWEIPDEITAEFVDLYYSSYMKDKNPSLALKHAKAQLKLKYAPRNWAAFRLLE
jgi:CHAT domain-containing protein